MMYLLFEEHLNPGSSAAVIQRTTVRALDGDSEGSGLAIHIERGGGLQVDVTFDAEEARELLGWCAAQLERIDQSDNV